MPIVQAGKQFTAEDLQRIAGDLASLTRDAIQRSNDFRIQLQTWPDADLVLLGLAQEEINAIKGYYVGDLAGISAAFTGSTWVKQLLGLGV